MTISAPWMISQRSRWSSHDRQSAAPAATTAAVANVPAELPELVEEYGVECEYNTCCHARYGTDVTGNKPRHEADGDRPAQRRTEALRLFAHQPQAPRDRLYRREHRVVVEDDLRRQRSPDRPTPDEVVVGETLVVSERSADADQSEQERCDTADKAGCDARRDSAVLPRTIDLGAGGCIVCWLVTHSVTLVRRPAPTQLPDCIDGGAPLRSGPERARHV